MKIAGAQSLLHAQITTNGQVAEASLKSADASRERHTRARREKAAEEMAAAEKDGTGANIKAGLMIGAAVASAVSSVLTLGTSSVVTASVMLVAKLAEAAPQIVDGTLKGDAADRRYEAALQDEAANSAQTMAERAEDRMRTAQAQSKENADFMLEQMRLIQSSSRLA